MSTYLLMKLLERIPDRYDRGMRILTHGRLDAAYDRLAAHVDTGQRVIDLGCGTGALALRAAAHGARVKAIDVNPRMLEFAESRAVERDLARYIAFREMGVAELGAEESECYDAVMSGLCFSELSDDELVFTLREVRRILKPEGLLLVADEVRPAGLGRLVMHAMIRGPLNLMTYLIAGLPSRAVRNLPAKIRKAGLSIESVRLNKMETFIELIGRKGAHGA
jgi:ubiquinone/menaquinone biosynthesis C-methylase UbiE